MRILKLILFLSVLLFSCGGGGGGTAGTSDSNGSAQSGSGEPIQAGIKGLILPAYAWWGEVGFWNRVESVKEPQMIVIFNVYNGPGEVKRKEWQELIDALSSARHIAVGYVFTLYGERSLDRVKKDIDAWLEFYPSIEGIFLDEVSEDNLSYYEELYNYIKSKGELKVILNPGTMLKKEFDSISDVVVYYEDDPKNLSNLKDNPFDEGAVIVHSFTGKLETLVNDLKAKGVNWIWITDDTPPNPYDTLPSYFDKLLEMSKP